jgi:hypothetical protein
MTGTAFYAAATFDSVINEAHTLVMRSTDSGLTWQVTQPHVGDTQIDAHPQTLDPYVYVDEASGRVFDVDTLAAASMDLSYSGGRPGAHLVHDARGRSRGDGPPDAVRGRPAGRESGGEAGPTELPEDRLLLRQLGPRLRL